MFAVVWLSFHFRLLDRFELVTYDYRCQLSQIEPTDPRIVVIEISDDSVAKIGRWPWPRDWHAALIQALEEFGAEAVVFDVVFAEPSDPAKDEALAQAIRGSGKVFLAEVIEAAPGAGQTRLLRSLPAMAGAAKGTGHINLEPDIDGVMRRIPLFLRHEGVLVPQLSMAVAMHLWGVGPQAVSLERRRATLALPDGSTLTVPLDEQSRFVIRWAGRWDKTFRHYSYADVISSYAAVKKGTKPTVWPDALEGKICYVGSTATGLFDIRPTPLEPAYPAVGVNLTVLDNLLTRSFVRPAPYWVNWLILLAVAVLVFRLLKSESYFHGGVQTLLLAVLYTLGAVALFVRAHWWVSIVYPFTLISATYFCVMLYNQLSVAIERAKLLKLATRDGLTGLYNIGHFKLLLKAEMQTVAMRREKKLSLAMGDVDNFKKTNDTYGHLTGDAVLREVANAVRSNCRALDVAARYGGEEFILMLPGANVEEAFKVADKIRKTIMTKMFFHEKGDFNTSISIGVTGISPDDTDLDAVIARADRALYEAKHTGKNKVMIASDSPQIDNAVDPAAGTGQGFKNSP